MSDAAPVGRTVERPVAIPILLYHSVSDHPSPEAEPFSVTIAAFAHQLGFLQDQALTPLTVSQLAAVLRGAAPLPDRPVVVTFDDGFADFHVHALPLLEEVGFASTVYITTGFIEDQPTERGVVRPGRMLSWSQIVEARDRGVQIGGHSHTHPQLDTLGRRQVRSEIERPKGLLEERLQSEVASFAFPHGYAGARERRLVGQAGYRSACAVRNRMSSSADDPWFLSRLTIRRSTTMDTFAEVLRRPWAPASFLRAQLLPRAWRVVRRSGARLLSHPV